MTPIGDAFLVAVARCQRRALFVAPFVKVGVLKKLISVLPSSAKLEVYTRWRPEEVAAGVSDLEVLDVVGERGGEVWLCQPLHAKYYRLDDEVWFGSANLTAAALGWALQPNIELLVSAPKVEPPFTEFEMVLFSAAIRATSEIRDQVLVASQQFRKEVHAPEELDSFPVTRNGVVWVPQARNPERLFRAYSKGLTGLTSAAREQARVDLDALGLPVSMNEEAFNAAIACALLQNRVVQSIDQFARSARRFGEMRELLGRELGKIGCEREPTEAWQTLMRWLLHFLPERYGAETARFSEIFQRR